MKNMYLFVLLSLTSAAYAIDFEDIRSGARYKLTSQEYAVVDCYDPATRDFKFKDRGINLASGIEIEVIHKDHTSAFYLVFAKSNSLDSSQSSLCQIRLSHFTSSLGGQGTAFSFEPIP